MKIRFAVAPGPSTTAPDDLESLVDGLEREGFDTIWLSDVPLGGAVDPVIGLALAAGRTRRLKLGANVVPFGRSPYVLARQLAQLDVLSRGRLLLTIVPGLDQPGERELLGIDGADRGRRIDELLPVLRAWWAGEAVEATGHGWTSPGARLPNLPAQRPLEVWLAGSGPKALARAGRLADGWLGAAVTPTEAAAARATIEGAATEAGRTFDPEHFGISIPYARHEIVGPTAERFRRRRPDVASADLVPTGDVELRRLVRRHVDAGLSKFVLIPVEPVRDWDDELAWLADGVLALQS